MVRSFDGVWNGRSDYAKYTLTSYNENRASGFFCRSTTSTDLFWPANGTSITSYAKAGLSRTKNQQKSDIAGYDVYDYKYYYTAVTFDEDELSELRGKSAKKILLEVEATLNDDDRIDIDMKKSATATNMARCDKNQNAIKSTKLGAWSDNSPNYVSRVDGVCTFDLTNDTGGTFAGVPTYGYVFGQSGTYKSASFSVSFLSAADLASTSKRAKLYVITNERQATLSFNANGGSGAPGSVTGVGANASCTVKIPSGTPTKSHKVFAGWATTSSGAVKYHPGDSVTINGDTTFYAVWSDRYIHFRYLPGTGGSGEFDLYPCTAGTTVSIVDVGYFVKKPGYDISGYSTTDGGAKEYDIGDTYECGDTDVTLYAVWSTATYTITYDANGGKDAPAAQTKTGGETITLSEDIPHRDGYTFLGWATTPTGGAAYHPGDSYSADLSQTLYAVWEEYMGVLHIAKYNGVKTVKVYVKTETGRRRADVFVMTVNGLKEGK